jgi:hypothetical protein
MNEYNSAYRKKEHKSVTLEKKLEMVRQIEYGEKQSNVMKWMDLTGSTIRTILKNKESINEVGKTTSWTFRQSEGLQPLYFPK